jgi:phage terminase large subunit-like protein
MTFDPRPELYPDPTGRADRVIRFVQRLTLWEGRYAGKRFELAPFQKAIIKRIYGPSDSQGRPLVRTACLWLPRGQGKTALASALALAHFLGPEAEPGGQVIMAAADREQASIAFKHSFEMARAEPAIYSRVAPIESRKTINHPKTSSVLKAISSESYSKHGLSVSFFLADEVHAWPTAEARQLFGTIRDSMVKREHALTLVISTAGEGVGGLAHDLWTYSNKIESGEIDDPTFAAIVFAAPADADWRDETAWRAANPALDCGFMSADELRIKAKRIEHFPAEISDFRRFHLNQWQEGAAEPWISIELYDAAEPRADEESLIGRPCWIGVDLSSVEDLTACVAVFPSDGDEGRVYDVAPMFFLPEANLLRKAEKDRADYVRWARDGFLKLTPGNVVDYDFLIDHIVDLASHYAVQTIAIDRWNSTAVNTRLQEKGFEVAQFGQGFASMAVPVRELKRAILAGGFHHGANPILRMNFANVTAETDAAENQKFVKSRATGRIDGAVAAAMAIGVILTNDQGPSVYSTGERPDGFLWI